jgi:hypothetical protein
MGNVAAGGAALGPFVEGTSNIGGGDVTTGVGDSELGAAVLPGIVVGGSPTGESSNGAEVGFFVFDVGDIPGLRVIEPPLGPGDALLLIGASVGEPTTTFVGPDDDTGNGSVSTVTVDTLRPVVVSMVVVSISPH